MHVAGIKAYVRLHSDGAEKDVKRLSKGENKEYSQWKNFEKSGGDFLKHDNIYSKLWLKAQKEDKVEPAQEDADSSQLPTPAVEAGKVAIAHKSDGGQVEDDLCIVEEIRQILPEVGHQLEDLRCEAK